MLLPEETHNGTKLKGIEKKYNKRRHMSILLFIFSFFITGNQLHAEQQKETSIYTIQISSFAETEMEANKKIANMLESKGYQDIRIEKIGGSYTLRVGRYTNREKAQETYASIKQMYPNSFLRTAYYIPERIVYPAPKPAVVETAPVQETKPSVTAPPTLPLETKAPSRPGWKSPLVLLLIFIAFLVLLLIPLLPGLREIIKPKDASPLFIKMDYAKDPRYFDRAFKKILENALQVDTETPGIKHVRLNKDEEVELCESRFVPESSSIENILYVKKTFVTDKKVRLKKEVYVRGSSLIGEENHLRALAGDGDINIGNRTVVLRWIGTSGNIIIQDECRLGIFCSCDGELNIGKGCFFKALYGKPIMTYGTTSIEPDRQENNQESHSQEIPEEVRSIEDLVWYSSAKYLSIPTGTKVEKDFVVKHNLILRKSCFVKGSLKAYGNIILEEGVTVDGNIFSEQEIIIGPDCTVTGDIFSQGYVQVGHGFYLGKTASIKSLIGKKGVQLTGKVVIYGYVLTEGQGKVI